jgi:hypothetical protein
MKNWIPVKDTIPNLHVLRDGPRELGMIERPHNTRTDQSAWRAFAGIGERARFLGHRWTKDGAKALVESALE